MARFMVSLVLFVAIMGYASAQCYSFHGCSECTASSSCGWCGTETKCVDGNSTGPLNPSVECHGWQYGSCDATKLKNGVQYTQRNTVKGTFNYFVYEDIDTSLSIGVYVDGLDTVTYLSQTSHEPNSKNHTWKGGYATIAASHELKDGKLYIGVFNAVSIDFKISVFQPAHDGGGDGSQGGSSSDTPIYINGSRTYLNLYYDSVNLCRTAHFLRDPSCDFEGDLCPQEGGSYVLKFALSSSCQVDLNDYLFINNTLDRPAGFALQTRCENVRGLCNCGTVNGVKQYSYMKAWFKDFDNCKESIFDYQEDCAIRSDPCTKVEDGDTGDIYYQVMFAGDRNHTCCTVPTSWMLANAPYKIAVKDSGMQFSSSSQADQVEQALE